MSFNGIDRLLWAIGLIGDIVLLAVLFRRRRARQFPWFTALIGLNAARSTVLSLVNSYGSAHAYLQAYFAMGFLDFSLQLGVVIELSSQIFRPLGRWAKDVWHSMLVIASLSLLLAGLLTAVAIPPRASMEFELLLRSNFFSATLMTELFLGMLGLAVTAGLPWRTHVARIAYGLGLYSLLDVAIETVHTVFGQANAPQTHVWLTTCRKLLYLGCLAYWMVTLWRDAPVQHELPQAVQKRLRSLEQQLAYDLYTIRKWRKL